MTEQVAVPFSLALLRPAPLLPKAVCLQPFRSRMLCCRRRPLQATMLRSNRTHRAPTAVPASVTFFFTLPKLGGSGAFLRTTPYLHTPPRTTGLTGARLLTYPLKHDLSNGQYNGQYNGRPKVELRRSGRAVCVWRARSTTPASPNTRFTLAVHGKGLSRVTLEMMAIRS